MGDMMDDQLLQLAFAIYNGPGVYALLLGSGISSSAEILTGWEVVVDLIRKIAAIYDENPGNDPEKWYADKFEKEPRYDDLLEQVGKTPQDRQAILRSYFEPNDDERERGAKLPTKAHHAIAWLVKRGYIRVILTTNFDRLLEKALEEVGIVPDVVSTDDALKGMRPLQHSQITVVKLHGDYVNSNIKNTADELASYSPALNVLLDRIFDEYGLIVCGWSGDWDTALVGAIERTIQRLDRYSTYWSSYQEPIDAAQRLIKLRDAQAINNMSADEFWVELQQSVEALENSFSQNPLSISVSVSRVKRLITAGNDIELEDFVRDVVEETFAVLTSDEFSNRIKILLQNSGQQNVYETIPSAYFEVMKRVLHVFIALAWYGNDSHAFLAKDAINRFAELTQIDDGYVWKYFPALFLIYGSGIVAVARSKWFWVYNILYLPQTKKRYGGYERVNLIEQICNELFISFGRDLPSNQAIGHYLQSRLRSLYRQYIPSDISFYFTFDLFETLLALVYIDIADDNWFPGHLPIYDNRSWEYIAEFWKEGAKKKTSWELLKGGLFDANIMRLEKTLKTYISIVPEYQRRLRLPDYASIYMAAQITGNK